MPSTPTYKNLDALIEQPTSGAIQYAERKQITKTYKGKYADCDADALAKGTEGSGALTGFVVAQSTVTPERGGIATLSIVWESGGPDGGTPLPPDEVGVQPDALSPRMELHSRYASLVGVTIGTVDGTEYILDVVYAAAHAQSYDDRKRQTDKLAGLTDALELLSKIRRGNETFYMAALRYVWATHYYTVPTMYRGGWTESPGGPLAGYFVSSISWLRESDDLQYSNGIWRLTRSWLGGPDGHWDTDIYS